MGRAQLQPGGRCSGGGGGGGGVRGQAGAGTVGVHHVVVLALGLAVCRGGGAPHALGLLPDLLPCVTWQQAGPTALARGAAPPPRHVLPPLTPVAGTPLKTLL